MFQVKILRKQAQAKDLALQEQPFPDVYKKGLLKNFIKFTGKQPHRSLYLMKL